MLLIKHFPLILQAVFLDFDGVVVESADIKTEAFYEIYKPYGEDVALHAKVYHLENQGVRRYKKFDDIHKLFLNKACSQEEKEQLSAQFSAIVFNKIIESPLVAGVLVFLEKMRKNNTPVFLLSATPHAELIAICERKKILGYFKAVYGAPYEKDTIGTQLLHDYAFDKKGVVFVGDSISDYKAAHAIGVNFIGRVGENMTNPFRADIPIINDFEDLNEST